MCNVNRRLGGAASRLPVYIMVLYVMALALVQQFSLQYVLQGASLRGRQRYACSGRKNRSKHTHACGVQVVSLQHGGVKRTEVLD